MAGKMPGKSNDGKRKNNERNHHNSNGGRSNGRQGNNGRGGRGGRGRGRGGRDGRSNNYSEHLKKLNVSIVAKRVIIIPTAQLQERMTMEVQTWYPKRISKSISIFIERYVDQKGKNKE
jgi:hypothetical protein